jgi:hypothetical protein
VMVRPRDVAASLFAKSSKYRPTGFLRASGDLTIISRGVPS